MSHNKPSRVKPSSKKKRKGLRDFFDFKNNQKNQVGLLLFIAFVASTILIYEFEERFDEERWKSLPDFRYEMVDDIIESDMFINKTKAEVISQLGQPNDSYSDEKLYFIYYLGREPSFFESRKMQLVFTFEKNRVTKVNQEPRPN